MPLIFHNFPDQRHAGAFAKHIRAAGLSARCWESQTAMHDAFEKSNTFGAEELADVFPFQLAGLVVTVERIDDINEEWEAAVIDSVQLFQGEYAGT